MMTIALIVTPHVINLWQKNRMYLAVYHDIREIKKLPGMFSKQNRSAQVAMKYLGQADRALSLGKHDIARSFLESAYFQYSSDFLVQYRLRLLERKAKVTGVDTDFNTDIAPDIDLIWYNSFQWDNQQIVILFDLLYQGAWPPSVIRVIDSANVLGIATQGFYTYVADSYTRAGFYQEAITFLNNLLEKTPNDDWIYLKIGQIQETWSSATTNGSDIVLSTLETYERAYHLSPSQSFALDKLIQINNSLGQHTEARYWENILRSQFDSREPEYQVIESQQVSSKWRLIGYDLQEDLMTIEGTAPACLWWSIPTGLDNSRLDGYLIDKNTLVQCIQITNLVTNGGFELDSKTGSMFPINFNSDIYVAPKELHGLSRDPIGERSGLVAWLSNNYNHKNTSFESHKFGIDPNTVYLQAAWVLSPTGDAYIGRLWLDNSTYSYLTNGSPQSWTHWAGLTYSPMNSSAAKVWLLNYQNQGVAYFDDILFARIKLP